MTLTLRTCAVGRRAHALAALSLAALLLGPAPCSAQSIPDGAPGSPVDEAGAPRETPPFSVHLVLGTLAGDVRHLKDSMPVVITGGLATAAAWQADDRVARSASGSASFERAFDAGGPLGHLALQTGSSLAALGTGLVLHKPTLTLVGARLVRAQFLSGAITHAIKRASQRTRPSGGPHSFPSGHTSSAFANATVLQRQFGWKVGVPAYVVASYVGIARVSENQHYLSDVIAGAVVGITVGRAVSVRMPSSTWMLQPAVGRGTAAVMITRR